MGTPTSAANPDPTQELESRAAPSSLALGCPERPECLLRHPHQRTRSAPGSNTTPIPQKPQGGPIKGYLMKFLQGFGDAAMKEAGLPTEYERQNQDIINKQHQAQTDSEAAEASLKKAQAQGLLDTIPVTMENGMTYHLPKALATKILAQQSGNAGREAVADTKAQSATDVATIRAQVQDRLAQAQLGLKQALADRNFDMAQKRFAEISRYHQAELGLQQGRMDLARESLDYRETGPTAQTKTAGQFAGTLTEKIPTLKAEIDRLSQAGKLGPIEGRWNDFLAGKIGSGDPEYNELRVGLSLFASGTARAHTSRTGIEAINYFKSLLAQPGRHLSKSNQG
jgi:hypothetical protein